MNRNCLLCVFFLLSASYLSGQSIKVYGKITNTRLEPLAFASVQVKEIKNGTVTKEDGTYELLMEAVCQVEPAQAN